ncbi:MAG: hypothetical protein B7Z72_01810 [Gemmatimonadetes bacterium 21-71-4]|nr:MAG: hypothetical protein B7Z72_01810 [Gemmatimonadetes bacterium 21-71-4]
MHHGGAAHPPWDARRRARVGRESAGAAGLRVRRRPSRADGRPPRRRTRARRDRRRGGHAVSLALYRIDDRLIHGQVVLGWGQPLDIRFIVLVDDAIAASAWERDLYRMAVPPGMDVYFETAADCCARLDEFRRDPRPGILLTADVDTMRAVAGSGGVPAVNLGGIHHRSDRTQRLRYVFLSPDEERALRDIAARGVTVTAQDVPSSHAVPLDEILTVGAPK